jgi:hypothetical protein
VSTLNQKHLVVERFEDEWAVLEVDAETTFPVPRSWLPGSVKEGDVLLSKVESGEDEVSLRFTIDAEATAKRWDAARALEKDAVKGPEGDIEL